MQYLSSNRTTGVLVATTFLVALASCASAPESEYELDEQAALTDVATPENGQLADAWNAVKKKLRLEPARPPGTTRQADTRIDITFQNPMFEGTGASTTGAPRADEDYLTNFKNPVFDPTFKPSDTEQ